MCQMAAYELVVRQVSIVNFLLYFPEDGSDFARGIGALRQALENRQYSRGQDAWRKSWKPIIRSRGIDPFTETVILESAEGFFSKSTENMGKQLEESRKFIENKIKEYEENYREKKRIVYPVAMLSGLALLIILI